MDYRTTVFPQSETTANNYFVMMKLSHPNAEAPEKYWCYWTFVCTRAV